MILQMTTEPGAGSNVLAHAGGWSESHWINSTLEPSSAIINNLLRARAWLLPRTAAVVGYRLASYTLDGAKVIPSGAQTVRQKIGPNPAEVTDIPNMSLTISGTGNTLANATRFAIKCVPDRLVVGGEYVNDPSWSQLLSTYLGLLTRNSWGFVGRDAGATAMRVKGIANGTITLFANASVYTVGTWLTLSRVIDDNGSVVRGTYQIAERIDTNPDKQYRMVGLDSTRVVSTPNGSVKSTVLSFNAYSNLNAVRIGVRKIGAPFEKYRGRASKRRK